MGAHISLPEVSHGGQKRTEEEGKEVKTISFFSCLPSSSLCSPPCEIGLPKFENEGVVCTAIALTSRHRLRSIGRDLPSFPSLGTQLSAQFHCRSRFYRGKISAKWNFAGIKRFGSLQVRLARRPVATRACCTAYFRIQTTQVLRLRLDRILRPETSPARLRARMTDF